MQYPTVNLRRVVINLRRLYDNVPRTQHYIQLHSAASICGYSSSFSGAVRSFFVSAQLYGLIDLSLKEYKLAFTPFAEKVFSLPTDPAAILEAALRPALFQHLYRAFNEDTKVPLTTLHTAMSQFELSEQHCHQAVDCYRMTMKYVRSVIAVDPLEFKSFHSRDAKLSISYSPELVKQDLLNYLTAEME